MDKKRQEVPFKVGRRALVLFGDVWAEAIGVIDTMVSDWGEAEHEVWRSVPASGYYVTTASVEDTEARRLPGQCPECFEVGTHAPDCARGKRIAENLALGAPPALAPFLMDAPPRLVLPGSGCNFYAVNMKTWALFYMVSYREGAVWRSVDGETFVGGTSDDDAMFIALGPDGPTLAPWGL